MTPETCICPAGPEARQAMMERFLEWPFQRYAKRNDCLLDHRCPLHGEKMQPAVWGRHKDMVLTVTWLQWESLMAKPSKIGTVTWELNPKPQGEWSVFQGHGAMTDEEWRLQWSIPNDVGQSSESMSERQARGVLTLINWVEGVKQRIDEEWKAKP